jgi:fermentation-respiration switch protein FrsA (DUF1100 family)
MKARRKHLLRLVILCGLLLLLAGMLRNFELSQVYYPSRILSATGAELGRPFEDVRFKASDGLPLHGWFYPARPDPLRKRDLVVLFCHGNAGNISHRLDACQALLDTGVGVFLFDYRGYGESGGQPSEEGTYLDAEAAHAWLVAKGFQGRDVIGYGESLGGGIVSELALRKPVAGLIIQSSFTNIPDLGSQLFPWLPVRWLSTIKYDTLSKLPKIRVPVLFMHSRTDELVRFGHAQRNFAAANEPKMLWELNGGHNDAVGDSAQFVAGVRKFLELLDGDGSGRPSDARAGFR